MVDIFVRLMPSNLADHKEGRHCTGFCICASSPMYSSCVECREERVCVDYSREIGVRKRRSVQIRSHARLLSTK